MNQWCDGADSLPASTPVVIAHEGEAREVIFHPTRGGRIPVLVRDRMVGHCRRHGSTSTKCE
ncbi:MAG: hypothetical protein U0527_06325 [Candidatus Eisenbacteria bacterium]